MVWHRYLPIENSKPTSGASGQHVGTRGWDVWDLNTFDGIGFSCELG